jgi:hypothetical protein
MKEDFEKRHTRISADAAKLFKSRVALYMGSWLTNFAGTPFVPNGAGWPGAAKNPGYQFPTGSIENEASTSSRLLLQQPRRWPRSIRTA